MNDYEPVMEPSIPLATTRRLTAISLACFSLTLGATVASAQDTRAKPTPAQVEKAKEHFANARLHHDAKEYLAAADEYEQAYAVLPNAEFIFNAAQVFRLAGEKEEALKRYEKYLHLAPKGRAAADARMHRSNLKREIATEAESKTTETSTGPTTESDGAVDANAGTSDTNTPSSAGADAGLTTTAPAARKGDGGKALRIAGIAAAGVGVAALGVGVVYGFGASGIESDLEGNTKWDMDAYDDGKAAERNMFIFYGVGAAAVAAGSVMYFLGRSKGESSDAPASLTVAPTASGTHGAGFILSGSF